MAIANIIQGSARRIFVVTNASKHMITWICVAQLMSRNSFDIGFFPYEKFFLIYDFFSYEI